MFSFGNKFKITLFGASHDQMVGVVVEGLKAGTTIDFDFISDELKRRRPSKENETKRIEEDEFAFISGLEEGHTTEAALVIALKNSNIKVEDYKDIKDVFRPGHADYSKFIKYNGFAYSTGGGIFSGRMTAPIVVAGAIAKKELAKDDIIIKSKVINGEANRTSVLEVRISGLKPGIGEPFFDSLESKLSHMLFSIPSVKGVVFGDVLDSIDEDIKRDVYILDGSPRTLYNHSGGIDGGISNGEEIFFKVYLKPISSDIEKLKTLDKSMNECEITMTGRHDKSIAGRVGVVLEAATAIVIYDELLR